MVDLSPKFIEKIQDLLIHTHKRIYKKGNHWYQPREDTGTTDAMTEAVFFLSCAT